jgi:hypothetical protein
MATGTLIVEEEGVEKQRVKAGGTQEEGAIKAGIPLEDLVVWPRDQRPKYYNPIFYEGRLKTFEGYPTLVFIRGAIEPKNAYEERRVRETLVKLGGQDAPDKWRGDNFPDGEDPDICLCGFATSNMAAARAHKKRWPDHHRLRPVGA